MKLLITRPYNDSIESKILIEERTDHIVDIAPLLEISYVPQLSKINDIPDNANIAITSANGVKALANFSDNRSYKLFVIGLASYETAVELGYVNIVLSEESRSHSNSQNLLNSLKAGLGDGEVIYHITSSRAKQYLKENLSELGYKYNAIELYEVKDIDFTCEVVEAIRNQEYSGFVICSERTANNFLNNIKKFDLENCLQKSKIFCLSPSISDVFNGYGNKNVFFPEKINMEELIKILGGIV